MPSIIATAIRDIRPNPFRRLDRYPLRPEKVEALRESLRSTGFWDNIVARLTADGRAEIAYGHHRLQALQFEYTPDQQVGVIVRDLSDEQMLQIMARENMEEWSTSAAVEIETVEAVVEAYAAGKITLPAPHKRTRRDLLRHAPCYVPGDDLRTSGDHPYTAETLGQFLGWTKPNGAAQSKVYNALTALELIEVGAATHETFAGLKTSDLEAAIEAANARRQEREQTARAWERHAQGAAKAAAAAPDATARETLRTRERHLTEQAELERRRAKDDAGRVVKAVAEKLRSGEIGRNQAAEVAAQVAPPPPPLGRAATPPPGIDEAVKKWLAALSHVLADDAAAEKLETLLEVAEAMRPGALEALAEGLEGLSVRALSLAKRCRHAVGEPKPANAGRSARGVALLDDRGVSACA